MSNWELLGEIKDSGYYISWKRQHKMIHMPEPMQPMSKASLVQISGRNGEFQVRGLTYAHSVFDIHAHRAGLKLFDETRHTGTLTEAQRIATELKRKIAKQFDDVTHSDNTGTLLLRPDLSFK